MKTLWHLVIQQSDRNNRTLLLYEHLPYLKFRLVKLIKNSFKQQII